MKLSTCLYALAASLALLADGAPTNARLPELELPYGTWRATKHEPKADVFEFRNIRYAAPPTGPLRFGRPNAPETVVGVQDGSYGPKCMQKESEPSFLNSKNATDFVPGISEDCLFLNVYVPGKSLRSLAGNTSVIVWLHGGSYLSGSKDELPELGLYDGTGLSFQADGSAIVVTINYRLGVFGWLGGPSANAGKVANLGLYDQRAALQWVQDYIHLVGGNSSSVSLWGSSAGAGSVVHHLLQHGGQTDPLFHKAVVQSPGFLTEWDDKFLEERYRNFTTGAGCPDGDLACLRKLDANVVLLAQEGYVPSPIPDGDWFNGPAILEFNDGNYWKGLESIVVTHVLNEGFPVVVPPGEEQPENAFTLWLEGTFRNKAIAARVRDKYQSDKGPDTSQAKLQEAVFNDIVFLCPARLTTTAYTGRAYAGVYSVAAASHGFDVFATWYSPTLPAESIIIGTATLNEAYQSYLVSHAVTGNVNSLRNPAQTIEWPRFPDENAEQLVALNATDKGFELASDERIVKSTCDFWVEIYRLLQKTVRCTKG